MKIALLSCGPSVLRYPGRDGFDLVIGVNTIVEQYECDYWVFGDAETFAKTLQPKGSPLLVTDAAAAFNLLNNHGAETARRFRSWARGPGWEDLSNPLPPDWQLCFSSCAALLLALYAGQIDPRDRGAGSIEVFGADMTGERYWDGREHAGLNDKRWRASGRGGNGW